MAPTHREERDRIGKLDPVNEPAPPNLGSAGELGPVGQSKQKEEPDMKDKDRIWRERAADADRGGPASPTGRGPAR